MSKPTDKSGGGADDLLSKLFEMDEESSPTQFSEETKVDRELQGPAAKLSPQVPVAEKKSLEDLLNTEIQPQPSKATAPPPPLPADESADIFDGILEEDPSSGERISIFSGAKPSGEPSFKGNAGQTETHSKAAFNSGKSEKTIMLDSSLESDSGGDPAQTFEVEKADGSEVDPIEAALSQYGDKAPPDDGKTEEIKRPEFKSMKSKSSPGETSKPALESISAADFVEGFSNKPIQVSSDVGPGRFSQVKEYASQWGLLVGAAFFAGGLIFTGYSKVRSDTGLLGYRLEGFSLEKAYRPPTEAEKLDFQKKFENALSARQADDPKKIEDSLVDLQAIVVTDERNLEAASTIAEHAALLSVWHGPKSVWPQKFEDALQQINLMLTKVKDPAPTPGLDRARAWKSLSMGEIGRAYGDLSGSVDRVPPTDETYGLLIELAYLNESKADVEKWSGKLTRKPGLRLKFYLALAKDEGAAIGELAAAGYLPAKVEELIRQSIRKESVDRLIQKSDSLLEEVAKYPPLEMRLRAFRGDLYSFLGGQKQARDEWKLVVEQAPRTANVWLKLAASYEEDAMWEEAVNSYREVEKLKALREEGILKFARLLRLQGKVLDAISVLDLGLKTFQKSARMYYEKGMVQSAIYQLDLAKESFNKALELDARLEPATLGLANLAIQRKEWTEAEALLKSIESKSPHHPEALLSLASISRSRYQLDQAERFTSLAITENPKLESAYPELVQLYLYDEKDELARTMVKTGLDVLPRSPLLKVAMARIDQFQGKLDEALSELEFPRKNFGHMKEVMYALADVLIDKKEITQAYDVLNPLVEKYSKDPELQYLRAKAFVNDTEQGRGLGSNEAAFRAVDFALRSDEQNLRYLLLTAQIALLLQDKNSATEHLESMLKIKPHYPKALIIRGDLYRDTGDYEHAAQAYTEALNHTRFHAPIYGRLADSFKSQGKTADAIQYFQKVVQANSNDSRAHLELGKLYSDEGRYLNSLKSLAMAVKLNPNVAETYYFLGFVHKELGDRKEAIKSFEKFLSMDPAGTEASTVRDEVYFLKGGTAN